MANKKGDNTGDNRKQKGDKTDTMTNKNGDKMKQKGDKTDTMTTKKGAFLQQHRPSNKPSCLVS